MNVGLFVPAPTRSEAFRRNRDHFVSEASGCYALTNFSKEVIYVGLAKNLRRRFNQHLDDQRKTAVTDLGKAILFWWCETEDINKVERTWMNIHIQHEGKLPLLNNAYSPTST
jgi:predicted GIY-YIG superfamily endonuclease